MDLDHRLEMQFQKEITLGIVEIMGITKWVLINPKGMYLVPRIYGKSMESL